MNPVDRPCLNRGAGCRRLSGYCFTADSPEREQELLHAHYGMRPDECRVCGRQHHGQLNDVCDDCQARVAGEVRAHRLARDRFARETNPHLHWPNVPAEEKARLAYEEVAA